MPAANADIASATREAAVATWSDAAVKARYPSARDGLAEPAEGFFDAIADAQTVANARGALVGTERNRFAVPVAEVLWLDPSTGTPTVTLVVSEHAQNGAALAARLELDLDGESTGVETFG
jgi:hypothetical protein